MRNEERERESWGNTENRTKREIYREPKREREREREREVKETKKGEFEKMSEISFLFFFLSTRG